MQFNPTDKMQPKDTLHEADQRPAALVTGATGLLGRYALAHLLEAGVQVAGTFLNHTPGSRQSGVGWHQMDLGTPQAKAALAAAAPSVIVHCAAYLPASFDDDTARTASAINRSIDDAVIAYCQSSGCRLVYLSGTSLYAMSEQGPFDEQDPVDPRGPYLKEKYKSECLICDCLADYAILRVSAPYGVGQRSKTVLQHFLSKAIAGDELLYYGSGQREQDFIFADDVARAIGCALRSDQTGVFNIASGQPVSMRTLAEMVIYATGSRSTVAAAGRPDPQEGYTAAFSIEKAQHFLDWQPRTTLADGLVVLADHVNEQS